MKTKLLIIIIALPSLLWSKNIDSLLSVLDRTIAEKDIYEKEKWKRINLIKEEIFSGIVSDEEQYLLYNRLYKEFDSFISDSASYYVDKNLELAKKLNHHKWYVQSLLNKVHLLSTSGLFSEAQYTLQSIDRGKLPPELLLDYYSCRENLYLYQSEYAIKECYTKKYLEAANRYRDSILTIVTPNTYAYMIVKAPRLIDQGNTKEAIRLLEGFCNSLKKDTHEYAVLTSILAFAYQCDGQKDAELETRICSAIADIHAAVKENYSLGALAELLFENNDLERANRYIRISMEDANNYNTRLRSLQTAKMFPLIDKAYQLEKRKQQNLMIKLIVGISVLTVILFITVLYVISQMKRLAAARKHVEFANEQLHQLNNELKQLNSEQATINEQLSLTNRNLSEANHIKEEYLGRFLSLSSSYISKLEDYRRMLNKLAAAGKIEELYRLLKSDQFIHKELKEFYYNFDTSFLNIFPNFVADFNLLLPENEQLIPKSDELLTTELRIFALIRLGITDSAKIAEFLRYSITTIYTYRSKLKNKSLCKEEFEERVMNITSF